MVIDKNVLVCNNSQQQSATMFVILIIGFTAGPAVSLYGSPTVSPVATDL